jgi:hypothetical protein
VTELADVAVVRVFEALLELVPGAPTDLLSIRTSLLFAGCVANPLLSVDFTAYRAAT